MENSTAVASILQCPVCCEYLQPPILQCINGHLTCSNCRRKLTRCAVCRAPLGNIRNLAMDRLASTLMLPCNYLTYGCAVSIQQTERSEHEDSCEFRPHPCLFQEAGCRWQGSREEVVPHLMKSHKFSPPLEDEDIGFPVPNTNLPGPLDWYYIVSHSGHNFIVVLSKLDTIDGYQEFWVTVLLIGTKQQAEHFIYKLELNGQGSQLPLEGKPISIHNKMSSAIKNSNYVEFTAKPFEENGNLSFIMSLSVV